MDTTESWRLDVNQKNRSHLREGSDGDEDFTHLTLPLPLFEKKKKTVNTLDQSIDPWSTSALKTSWSNGMYKPDVSDRVFWKKQVPED